MSEEVKTARGGKRGGPKKNQDGEAKGQAAAEGDRPQTSRARGSYGKNNRGGDRGRGGKRPQTAREDGGAAEESKQQQQPGGGKQKQNRERPQDKNSWIYKYHHMPVPQYEAITFTAETEIPEIPAVKDRLKEPVRVDFDRSMDAQNELINAQRAKKDALIRKRREIREGGLSGHGDKTKRGEFVERINVVKEVRQQKQRKNDAFKAIVAQIDELENERSSLVKLMHPDCRTVEAVNQLSKQLERRLTTTSVSKQQEQKIIKEIDQLKNSTDKVARYQTIDAEVGTLKQKKNKAWGEIKDLRAQENTLNEEMEALRKEMEETNAEKDETRAKADAVSLQIDEADKQLNELYKKKDELREEFWKARFDFKTQREEIQHIEWMQRQKDKVLNQVALKKEREEERKDAISNLPHPYIKEMDACDHLVNFFQTLKVRYGLVAPDSEELARQTQQAMAKEQVRERFKEKLDAGKVEVGKTKAEREAENTVQVGGGKKRKGKKPKQVIEVEDTLSLDIVIMQKLNLVGVTAPMQPEELDDRIEKVTERKAWYQENGVSKLQEQIADIQKMADEEEKLYEQEAKSAQEEASASRGRRGGRGGYRGGRAGASAARGRGRGPRDYQGAADGDNEVAEFDDWGAYAAPTSKPARGKQSKEQLSLNDDNYPTMM